MLTLDAILKATKQMSSYGERGTNGAMDHLPDRVQGQPVAREIDLCPDVEGDETVSARRWDNELKVYICD